ncbi:uncharacterized protein BJ212DRAFT_619882 [Suillus subaureus]|uniref:DUF6533 domain-containing protein n=1 Tax=Suillus subaureus TaxID=48587 RepID=A0A9P7E1V1_9AGAM|nr:uncharacterized protein BJ212DRAFT_619882 [Suillus subaureus]KAG1809169.1 hypothetical protein BJ212DRAFT_619882 [Suillus subaureus]
MTDCPLSEITLCFRLVSSQPNGNHIHSLPLMGSQLIHKRDKKSCARNLGFFLPERMQMAYSADDIAAARNLQLLAYICTSTATFWTYDFVCSLHEELTFLLRSRWTKVKGLYIIARYVPFVLIILVLCSTLAQNENPEKCRILSNISAFFGLMSLTFSECFFTLRTYALWSNNRIVLVAMLSALFATVVSSVSLVLVAGVTSEVTTSAIPGIPGCSGSPHGVLLFLPYILMFVFQLGLVCLTIIRVIQSWRSAKGLLYAMLVKHNIFYHACGLLFSAVNVLLPMLLSDVYSVYSSLEGLQIFILAILATRMHLHLWHVERHVDGSEALVRISIEI